MIKEEALQLLSSLDINGQTLKRRVIASSSDLPRTQAEESLSVADLRHKLHLYKVRFLLLTRNLKAAKREVKMAMNIAHAKNYPIALYLKSQLEYARGNHRKAIKLLMASSINTESLLLLAISTNALLANRVVLGPLNSRLSSFPLGPLLREGEWAFGDDPYEAPFRRREMLERTRKMRVSHKEKRKMKSLGRQVTRDRGRLTLPSLKLANAHCLVEE
ncbi:hypothetical protein Sango_0783500 [Sesamum angolense]|uniref:Uncharacterized protein n=1 Tax=Sesamum angolense TaxID=2727404 RepID=A0AAE2C045_9LAMI|nr:hypothetical protein Sango_0783500 [Sesamum angolense]